MENSLDSYRKEDFTVDGAFNEIENLILRKFCSKNVFFFFRNKQFLKNSWDNEILFNSQIRLPEQQCCFRVQ